MDVSDYLLLSPNGRGGRAQNGPGVATVDKKPKRLNSHTFGTQPERLGQTHSRESMHGDVDSSARRNDCAFPTDQAAV